MTEREVRWSVDAERDLEDIAGHIAQEHPANALAVLERVIARAGKLRTMASRGCRVPEIASATEPPLRELVEDVWRVMYVVQDDRVIVVAVVDSRRDIAAWLTRHFGIPTDAP